MRKIRTSIVATTTALVLTGCSMTGAGMGGSNSGGMGGNSGMMDSGQSSENHDSDDHNSIDTMFARMMIPHHEDAIVMAEVLLDRDDARPAVRDLASQISTAQADENAQMSAWLETHAGGGDMGGMMSGPTLEEARAAARDTPTADVETTFLQEMISHHDHGVTMAQNAADGGRSPEMVELASGMVAVQTAEIEEMEDLLAS